MSTDPRAVDLASERAVLGACLLHPSAWSRYAEAGLQESDFYRVGHRRLFAACVTAEGQSGRVNEIAVGRVLRAQEAADEVGGWGYLGELQIGAPEPDSVSAASLVRHLRKLARTRALQAHARVLSAACEASYMGLEDDECAEHLATLDALTQQGAEIRVLDAPAQVLRGMAYQAERRQDRAARFGVPSIDALLDGIRPGRVYGVMARTSVGKTIFGCHVATTHGTDDRGLLFVSLEMAAEEVIGRLARMGLRAADADYRIADYADAYIAHYGTVAICDRPGLTLAQVEQLIRSVQRHRPLATTVIDYLGLLRSSTRGQSAYERMSEHAVELKEVAKRTKTALIVLIQVSRQGGGDGSEELVLSSGRDSGVIEEALDACIGLRWLGAAKALTEAQRAEWRDVLWARVVKNRHGRISDGEHALKRDPQTMALTPDDLLKFPEETVRAAKKAAERGGY